MLPPPAASMAMTTASTLTHYQAYRAKPFTREERKDVTILFGGLTWKHERLIQGAMQNLNYKAQALPNVARADLDAGKELIDVGACCPTTFTTGNLVNFLKSEVAQRGRDEVTKKYVFLTAGSCGPCRFGQYHESYEMALDSLGLRDFRLFLLAQDQLDQGAVTGGGLEINMQLTTGLVWAILCADVLTDLEYMTRPYEVTAGQTDQALRESIEDLHQVFRDRPLKGTNKWTVLAWHLTTGYFTSALRRILRRWEAIEVDRLRVKARVKITGEFWLQTHEGDGNYNIKRWLEQEGAESIPPPIAVWLHYLLHPAMRTPTKRQTMQRGFTVKRAVHHGLERLYRLTYDRLRRALGNLPCELPDQIELKNLADPFYHYQLRGGEGHLLIGKALYAYHHRKAHMVCELTPYSCMPNTMSVGAMANVLGTFPDLLYAPIEIKGDAEIHALSRCQMILTEAKKRAQRELDDVFARMGVSVEAVRAGEARHPEVRRASYRVPHMGYAATAANYVAHLAQSGRVARGC
jgi:predicted nucleotide-binding protein (sugar kinase/HSP70/actin superfamily)